jgi:hypothetical protein
LVAGPAIACTALLEDLEHLVLGVGGVERVERAALGRALQRLGVQLEQLRGLRALDAALDERLQDVVHDVDGVDEVRRGAARGRRRVVELVREPGRHRAQ